MRAFVRTLAAVVLVAIAGAAVGWLWISSHRFSAKATPSRVEEFFARRVRRLATGSDARNRMNPVARSAEVVRSGMEHFADHCSICHANDGSGQTEMGRGLYPKAPDMRLPATQSLTDGELFFIIENGVRFTGMPAWSTGTSDGETASWHLVHFIRHLPEITADEIAAMEALNPKPPAEIRQQLEEEKFLSGAEPEKPSPGPQHTHK